VGLRDAAVAALPPSGLGPVARHCDYAPAHPAAAQPDAAPEEGVNLAWSVEVVRSAADEEEP
jgi:hypothetical protein